MLSPKLQLFYSGDTGYSRDFADIQARFAPRQGPAQGGGFDLALLPVGAYEPRWFMKDQHVNPEESVRIHRELGAKRSLGVHWGTFALTDEALDQPPRDLAAARQAQGVAADDFFTLAIGETRTLPERQPHDEHRHRSAPIALDWQGRVDYAATFAAMKQFTLERTPDTPDALWICEHAPVFTQGIAGRQDHILNPGEIPVVQTDRGGQVTFHGPGQVVAYPLIDLRRANCFVKEYVYRLEEAVLRTLSHFGVTGHRVAGAPGIYVRLDDPFSHAALTGPRPEHDPFRGLGKIAALGIKVSRHATYHGVALNVDMDLEPFSRINPCGYAGLQTVDLSTIGVQSTWEEAAAVLGRKLGTFLAP